MIAFSVYSTAEVCVNTLRLRENQILLLAKNISCDIYYFRGVITMETAKIFENGRSQAVRLPKKFRFNTDEVIVQQLGDAAI